MGRELEKLKASGALVLDFGAKSFLDQGTNQNDGTPGTGCYFSGGGLSVPTSCGVVVPHATSLQLSNLFLLFHIPGGLKAQGSNQYLIDKRTATITTNATIAFLTSTGVTLVTDNTVTATANLIGCEYIAISTTGTGTPVLYTDKHLDGVSFSGTCSLSTNAADITVGSRYTLTDNITSVVGMTIYSGDNKSATEVLRIFAELEELQTLRETTHIDTVLPSLKPASDTAGLVLSPGEVVGDQWVDDTESGNDGTITGASPVNTVMGEALRGDGSAHEVDHGACGTVNAASFWCKLESTTEDLIDFDGGTHVIEAIAGVITATGFSSPSIFINGASGTAISADEWTHVLVSTATGFTASALKTVLCDGLMTSPEVYSQVPFSNLAAFAQLEYQKGMGAAQAFGYNIRESVSAQTGYIEDTGIVTDMSAKIIGEHITVGETVLHTKALEAQAGGDADFSKVIDVAKYPHLYGYYDSGSGYVRGEISHTDGAVTMASGDKIILADQRGRRNLIARPVEE